MKSDSKRSKSSSLLVSDLGLAAFALGFVLSLRLKSILTAGLCLFFLLLGLVCRYWSGRVTNQLSFHIECRRTRLFPGQETAISYEVTNNKLLPLIWLELSQNGPDKDCLLPDEAFEAYDVPYDADHTVPFLRQSFSFIGSFQTLRVDSRWTAQRRGLYIIDRLVARSGDGFGLSQIERPLSARELPMLAVYPRPAEVDLSLFLRPQWDTNIGSRGWMEDNTVLKGNREYQPGDNWKHINWRMAAREQGTPINLYESIQPHGMRFILDGESFNSCPDELESVLEILASVLMGLSDAGINCSLSLPASKRFPAMTLRSSGANSVDDLLLHIAGYDPLAELDETAQQTPDTPVYLPSAFPTDAVPRTGSIFLLTRSGAELPQRLMRRMPMGKCLILCSEATESAERLGVRALSINTLRKGGSAS